MPPRILLLLIVLPILLSASISFGSEKITVQLRWSHGFQFAGYYAAIEKGFYKDAGFEVTVREGGVAVDTVNQVLTGKAQYGVTNSELLVHRAKGDPVVALAAIFQHSPHVFLTRRATGIRNPQDFIGKVVKMSSDARDIELHAMLKSEGVDLDQLVVLEEQAGPDDYLDPHIDAVGAYITDQSFYLEQAKVDYTIIAPATYGIDFYGDTLFTSQTQIDRDSQQVEKFRQASLLGWRYAMNNPEEIVDFLITKYGCTKQRDHLLSEARAMEKLILPKMIELGHMNPGRWQHIGGIFAQGGAIPDDFSLQGFIFDPSQPQDTFFQKISLGLLAILFCVLLIALVLFIFNRIFKRQIIEHQKTSIALKESQKKLYFSNKQTEQFSLSAASILSIKDEKEFFANISKTIVNYSDFNRVLISLFNDDPPYRNLIGFAGVSEEIVERVKNTEISKQCYSKVFEKGYKVGNFSYYIPHEMSDILNQQATIFGEGDCEALPGKWHPRDNLFVRMEDENGNFCGVISVDGSKSGLRPTDDIVRPLEIYASFISQIILLRRTEQMRANLEIQLRQAQKMEAIGNLAGGVAHDFNNILSVIIGNVELALLLKPQEERYVSYLQDIRKASSRAKDVVQHLLTFSRKKESGFETIAIQEIIEDSLNFLRSTLPSSISMEVDLHLEDVYVDADSTQISQIILNICTNAAHAMEGIVGKLEVKAAVEHKNCETTTGLSGEYLKLEIIDNGHGISREHIHQIYDPYFTTKDIGKGTGMGLAVVHGILLNHSGFVSVESVPGRTAFSIYLPVSTGKATQKTELPQNMLGGLRGTGKILLVDDNIELLKVTSQQLTALGYSVKSFSSSQEGLQHFLKDPSSYDLVITDMTMPHLSGKELVAEILRVRPQIPTFICTGFSEKINEKLAMEVGVKQYFEKPVSIEQLARAMKNELLK